MCPVVGGCHGNLAMPSDLVPDFIPVLGYADDAIIVAAVNAELRTEPVPDTRSGTSATDKQGR